MGLSIKDLERNWQAYYEVVVDVAYWKPLLWDSTIRSINAGIAARTAKVKAWDATKPQRRAAKRALATEAARRARAAAREGAPDADKLRKEAAAAADEAAKPDVLPEAMRSCDAESHILNLLDDMTVVLIQGGVWCHRHYEHHPILSFLRNVPAFVSLADQFWTDYDAGVIAAKCPWAEKPAVDPVAVLAELRVGRAPGDVRIALETADAVAAAKGEQLSARKKQMLDTMRYTDELGNAMPWLPPAAMAPGGHAAPPAPPAALPPPAAAAAAIHPLQEALWAAKRAKNAQVKVVRDAEHALEMGAVDGADERARIALKHALFVAKASLADREVDLEEAERRFASGDSRRVRARPGGGRRFGGGPDRGDRGGGGGGRPARLRPGRGGGGGGRGGGGGGGGRPARARPGRPWPERGGGGRIGQPERSRPERGGGGGGSACARPERGSHCVLPALRGQPHRRPRLWGPRARRRGRGPAARWGRGRGGHGCRRRRRHARVARLCGHLRDGRRDRAPLGGPGRQGGGGPQGRRAAAAGAAAAEDEGCARQVLPAPQQERPHDLERLGEKRRLPGRARQAPQRRAAPRRAQPAVGREGRRAWTSGWRRTGSTWCTTGASRCTST